MPSWTLKKLKVSFILVWFILMSYCDHLGSSSSKNIINKSLKWKHSFTPCARTHTHARTILKMLSRIRASSIANLKSCGTAAPSRAASINYWLSSGDLSKSLNHINLKITSLMWSAECARCKAICLPRRHSKTHCQKWWSHWHKIWF